MTTQDPGDAGAAAPSSELALRVTRLEQELRRVRRRGLALLITTAMLLGLGAALVITAARHGMPGFVPQVVESREFLLRDETGRVRAAWGADPEGAIRFVLQDPRNASSVKLSLLDDGTAGLTLADSAGSPRVVLGLLPDETASLVFGDRVGLTRTVLSFSPNGASTLVFADRGGNTQAGIGVNHRGTAMLSVKGLLEEAAEEPPR